MVFRCRFHADGAEPATWRHQEVPAACPPRTRSTIERCECSLISSSAHGHFRTVRSAVAKQCTRTTQTLNSADDPQPDSQVSGAVLRTHAHERHSGGDSPAIHLSLACCPEDGAEYQHHTPNDVEERTRLALRGARSARRNRASQAQTGSRALFHSR